MGLNVNSITMTTCFMTQCYVAVPTVLGAELETTSQHADTKLKDTSILLHAQARKVEVTQRMIGSDSLAVY